jgi:3-oxoacyl-[acyl-carrier-protein] synthase-3
MAKKMFSSRFETSRVVDIHDRPMIYSDGAGAIIEASDDETGMLAYESATYAVDESHYLFFGKSYNLI